MAGRLSPLDEKVLLIYSLQGPAGPGRTPTEADFDGAYTLEQIQASERQLLEEGYLKGHLSRAHTGGAKGVLVNGRIDERGVFYIAENLKEL
jgi:hypothetical protein